MIKLIYVHLLILFIFTSYQEAAYSVSIHFTIGQYKSILAYHWSFVLYGDIFIGTISSIATKDITLQQ